MGRNRQNPGLGAGASGGSEYVGAAMRKANQGLARKRRQRGFSLIEVLISMAVMTIGICAVLMVFATAIRATSSAEEDLVARHKAMDAMESIYTARNSQQLPFASINNVASGGVFLSGAQTLQCAGPD